MNLTAAGIVRNASARQACAIVSMLTPIQIFGAHDSSSAIRASL